MRYVNDKTGQVVTVDGYLVRGDRVLKSLGFREVDESAFAALAQHDREKAAGTNREANSMAKEKTVRTPKADIAVGQNGTKDIKGTTVSFTRTEEKKYVGHYTLAGKEYDVTASTYDSLVSSVSHKIAKLTKAPAATTAAPADTTTTAPSGEGAQS